MTLDLIALAYLLDWIIGDPQWLPHPVRLIGLVIETGEDLTRKLASGRVGEFIAGMLLTVVVVSATFAASHYLIRCATIINSLAATILMVYLAATTMASRNLIDEAWSVYRALQTHDLNKARLRVG